jgi:hypothetical protein
MASDTEDFTYDEASNLLAVLHQVSSGTWRRRYAYNEPSRIDAAATCNRLSATSRPGDPTNGPYTATYGHDAHGNLIRMPHLPEMRWDALDRLQSTTRQIVNNTTPEKTFYTYDSIGQRVVESGSIWGRSRFTASSTSMARPSRLSARQWWSRQAESASCLWKPGQWMTAQTGHPCR